MFTILQLYDAKVDLIIRSLNHNVLRDFSFAKIPEFRHIISGIRTQCRNLLNSVSRLSISFRFGIDN